MKLKYSDEYLQKSEDILKIPVFFYLFLMGIFLIGNLCFFINCQNLHVKVFY